MKLCRLCHLETLPNYHKNLFFDKTDDVEILDVIEVLTGLKINERDPFPQLICCDCHGKLVSFYHFRQLVMQADQRYHQEFANSEQDPFETVDIKRENDRNSSGEADEDNHHPVSDMDKVMKRNRKKRNGLLKKLLEAGDNSNETNLPLLCEIKTENVPCEGENNQQLKLEEDADDASSEDRIEELQDNDKLQKCTQCGIETTTQQICVNCDKQQPIAELDQLFRANRKCNECNKMFVSLCNLKRHMLTVHSGVRLYLCNICGQSFAVNDTLQRHLKTHSNVKSYQCNYCGKCFLSKGYLRKHLNVHTPQNLFACHICDRTFKQKSYLNVHLNVHFANKRYNCKICDKQFSHKSNLNTHMRVHNGEKRFECDYCGKRFLVKCNLKKHLEVHNK